MRQIAYYISMAEPELSSSAALGTNRREGLHVPHLLDRFIHYCAGDAG